MKCEHNWIINSFQNKFDCQRQKNEKQKKNYRNAAVFCFIRFGSIFINILL